jgi:hypothetical protein
MFWRLLARPATLRIAFVSAVALAVVVGVLGLFPVRSQTPTLDGPRTEEPIPVDDPWAEIWETTSAEIVPLSAQNIAPPFGGGTVSAVTARALHDGQRMYFLVEWDDAGADTSVAGNNLFSDAAALQFPIGDGEAPYTMGGAGLPVNIWQWKAVWQADIESGFETIQDRLSNTYVDDYQQADDPLYRSAEGAGNILAQRDRTTPVENLVAEGFGTLTTADVQDVEGVGAWSDGRWRVLFIREFEPADPELASFGVGEVTSVAFAVWDGNSGDRNGQKSIAQFIELRLVDESVTPSDGETAGTVILLTLLVVGLALLVAYGVTRKTEASDKSA